MQAVDCQSFAGAFTLGIARAGFEVTHKRENVGGFGVPLVMANTHLINENLDIQVAKPDAWARVRKPDLVFGNPPCSGFSGLTIVSNRTGWGTGAEHGINSCMWDLIGYAGRCEAPVVIMESVQMAYTKGRELMQALRFEMEERVGRRYDLTHVLHNNASVGGASLRRRYFMVLSRRGMGFGIEPPTLERMTTMSELLWDMPKKLSMEPQRYARKPKPYVAQNLRNGSEFVDGHQVRTSAEVRCMEWISANVEWLPGEHLGTATRRAIQRVGLENIPEYMKGPDGYVKRSLLADHAYSPRRWAGHKMAMVVTGTGAEDIVHPELPRTITYRECARIIGFPDEWSLASLSGPGGPSNNQKWLGKGISVPCGEWIGRWAREALSGEPGPWRGKLIGDREWYINVTNDYKAVYNDRTGAHEDSRPTILKKEMDSRLVA